MAVNKYDKQIIAMPTTQPRHPEMIYPIVNIKAANWGNIPFSMRFEPIHQPLLMIKEPHKHEFDQLLIFAGSDATNFADFDAEIELYLGEEGEKHVITQASVVYVPRGLIHGPLNYKIVRKPIVFYDVQLTTQYKRDAVNT